MNVLRQLVEWDTVVRTWLTTYHHPAADVVMHGLSIIGRGSSVWLAITLALLVLKRIQWRAAVPVFAAIALAIVMTDVIIKPLVARARPFEGAVAVRVIDRRPLTYSFPSGHAAGSFAAAATLAQVWSPGSAVFWTLAALVAVSRIYVGVHYPLDVLGGALLGLACAWLVHRVKRSVRLQPDAHGHS